MEYRLVLGDESIDFLAEATTELLYSITPQRHRIFRRKYVITENAVELVPRFLSWRRWSIKQQGNSIARITFRSRLFGRKVILSLADSTYVSSMVNSKIYFREKDSLNTGIIIEPMKSPQFIRITHSEYFDPIISSLVTLLMHKKNRV